MLADRNGVHARRVGQHEIPIGGLWVAQQPVGAGAPLLKPAQPGRPRHQVGRDIAGGDLDIVEQRLDLRPVAGHDEPQIGGQRLDLLQRGRVDRLGREAQQEYAHVGS